MGSKTGIEWTDSTWNPIYGCSRVSEGCRNCYAERLVGRFRENGPTVYDGLTRIESGRAVWTGQVAMAHEDRLLMPLKWRPVRQYDADDGERYADRRRRIFVNSMSDLFHENVTDEMRDRIFAVMALCPQHDFQVLTKRPERMLDYVMGIARSQARSEALGLAYTQLKGNRKGDGIVWPLANVWLGVSVEDQKTADARIPLLLQTPAAVRFVSCEPLLGPVDLMAVPRPDVPYFQAVGERGAIGPKDEPDDFRYWMKKGLHWVIAGGESGPVARPMHPDWVGSLRDQCKAAGVPFFFKQWGEFWAAEQGQYACPENLRQLGEGDPEPDWFRVGKKAAGSLLDGVEWKQFPEVRV